MHEVARLGLVSFTSFSSVGTWSRRDETIRARRRRASVQLAHPRF
jgi:hypothetical protein